MRRRVYGWALGLPLILLGSLRLSSQVPFDCTGQFYISFTTPTTSSLVEAVIDPNTDQVEFVIINANLQTFINGAGYRVTDNFIYCVEPLFHNLYQIDRFGQVTDFGVINLNPNHVYLAGDISPDGKYLVLIGTPGSSPQNRDAEIRLVDLSTAGFPVTARPLNGVAVNMLDIAFDPTDGTLYGVDARENRLVLIDFNTGAVSAPFDPTSLMDDAGSLFFDSFGDLYAYGGPPGNNGIQNTLYKVNKNDGTFEILTTGTRAIATDGCSCPHTVELRKEVFPRMTIPCADVRYVFTIANSSAEIQSGISMADTLPPDFTIKEIVYNPYGGTIRSGVGTGVLNLEDMNLLPGIDSIIIIVTVGDVVNGTYKNQSAISGLPQALGQTVLSDDPTTIIKRDSTSLVVANYPEDIFTELAICTGELLVLDATQYATTFLWDDGSRFPTRTIATGGTYSVTATTACDTVVVTYLVSESSISLGFNPDLFEIKYGDSVLLTPQILNSGDQTIFQWFVPEGDQVPCASCPEIQVAPYRDTEYSLLVENEAGCQAVAHVLIKVDRTIRMFAPNIFSPNGDDINDEFYVRIRGIAEFRRFAIFDRWGNTIYSGTTGLTSNPEIRWPGTSGSNHRLAQPGVYVWMAEVVFGDGTEEVFSGDVTLVR